MVYTFDRAVWSWGRWVDNRLAETDKKGRRVWTLEELLDSDTLPTVPQSKQGNVMQLRALFGGGNRLMVKK